jgi:hypothetical protein
MPCLLWSATATSAPVHGVIIGREAYHNLADRRSYHTPNPGLSRREVLEEYLKQCDCSQERRLQGPHSSALSYMYKSGINK